MLMEGLVYGWGDLRDLISGMGSRKHSDVMTQRSVLMFIFMIYGLFMEILVASSVYRQ